jgi:two-component system phosphate regulon sensor histidine kinase PhoR
VENGLVRMSNKAARSVLGPGIDGSDVRLAIRHPAAVERLLGRASSDGEDVELVGVGEAERRWVMSVTPLGESAVFVRLTDRSEAHAAERMRVDFVANASHELRTPLSSLIGYTETLREGEGLDEETRDRFLGVVHDEAKRMQRIVEDLISLSRIEAERFSPPTERLDLLPLIETVSANNRLMAAERGSAIAIEADESVPAVIGDRAQILQLLDNLIGNALRYGRAGSPVRVSVRREGEMAHVEVADQGDGIAAEHIPRITERFYRVDAGRSRSLGGTGLGLSIVKHIVERHRGRLDIRSILGEGTCVHVDLPLAG